MIDFLEIDENKKTISSLDLDDLSIEDLKTYIDELKREIIRVKSEIDKKENIKKQASRLFK